MQPAQLGAAELCANCRAIKDRRIREGTALLAGASDEHTYLIMTTMDLQELLTVAGLRKGRVTEIVQRAFYEYNAPKLVNLDQIWGPSWG